MVDLMNLIISDRDVSNAVNMIAISHFTFTADDLDMMPEEIYHIVEPFYIAWVKEFVEENISGMKDMGLVRDEIPLIEIAEEGAKRAVELINKDALTMAKIWSVVFNDIENQSDDEEDARRKILGLAKGCRWEPKDE